MSPLSMWACTSSAVGGGSTAASKPQRLGSSDLSFCLRGMPLPLTSSPKNGLLEVLYVAILLLLLCGVDTPAFWFFIEVSSISILVTCWQAMIVVIVIQCGKQNLSPVYRWAVGEALYRIHQYMILEAFQIRHCPGGEGEAHISNTSYHNGIKAKSVLPSLPACTQTIRKMCYRHTSTNTVNEVEYGYV